MKLYVGNLGGDGSGGGGGSEHGQGQVTADELRSLFEQYGEITECECIKNYAFVHIVDEDGARRAVKELNGTLINGRRIRVEHSESRGRGGGGHGGGRGPRSGPSPGMRSRATQKLFVGNIAAGTTSQQLRDAFAEVCNVAEADVIRNYGFVHVDADSGSGRINDIVHQMDGYNLNGSNIRVQLSTSGVRQKPGMGGEDHCFRCGGSGHWSKECPRYSDNGSPRSAFDRDQETSYQQQARSGVAPWGNNANGRSFGGAGGPYRGNSRGVGGSFSSSSVSPYRGGGGGFGGGPSTIEPYPTPPRHRAMMNSNIEHFDKGVGGNRGGHNLTMDSAYQANEVRAQMMPYGGNRDADQGPNAYQSVPDSYVDEGSNGNFNGYQGDAALDGPQQQDGYTSVFMTGSGGGAGAGMGFGMTSRMDPRKMGPRYQRGPLTTEQMMLMIRPPAHSAYGSGFGNNFASSYGSPIPGHPSQGYNYGGGLGDGMNASVGGYDSGIGGGGFGSGGGGSTGPYGMY